MNLPLPVMGFIILLVALIGAMILSAFKRMEGDMAVLVFCAGVVGTLFMVFG